MSLAEHLGLAPSARFVIVTGDELGSSHAANAGVRAAVRAGSATAAGLVVPGPWAREAAAHDEGFDTGVHLTLNAEHDLYRWGPITHAPSLLDGDGGFPRTREDVWDHADLDEVRRECRAQVERALTWGFDVTHLSSHLGATTDRPEFFDVALELAAECGLPLRLGSEATEAEAGFPYRRLAAEEGVAFPDRVVTLRGPDPRRALERVLGDLGPGVTEVVLRPAADTPELRALDPEWARRVDDLRLLASAGARALVEAAGAVPIGWRALRDLQRSSARHGAETFPG